MLRKVAGNWTFVVVTARVELDDQIAKTFKATGAVSEAESGAHLRELLRGNHRYVFTLIHKFQTPELLCARPDVIVLTDEAHRSQYDTLALNMRAALEKELARYNLAADQQAELSARLGVLNTELKYLSLCACPFVRLFPPEKLEPFMPPSTMPSEVAPAGLLLKWPASLAFTHRQGLG